MIIMLKLQYMFYLINYYLYKGIPVVSLNHKTNFTASCTFGGVKSHGSSTSFSIAAQTTRAGTKNIYLLILLNDHFDIFSKH